MPALSPAAAPLFHPPDLTTFRMVRDNAVRRGNKALILQPTGELTSNRASGGNPLKRLARFLAGKLGFSTPAMRRNATTMEAFRRAVREDFGDGALSRWNRVCAIQGVKPQRGAAPLTVNLMDHLFEELQPAVTNRGYLASYFPGGRDFKALKDEESWVSAHEGEIRSLPRDTLLRESAAQLATLYGASIFDDDMPPSKVRGAVMQAMRVAVAQNR